MWRNQGDGFLTGDGIGAVGNGTKDEAVSSDATSWAPEKAANSEEALNGPVTGLDASSVGTSCRSLAVGLGSVVVWPVVVCTDGAPDEAVNADGAPVTGTPPDEEGAAVDVRRGASDAGDVLVAIVGSKGRARKVTVGDEAPPDGPCDVDGVTGGTCSWCCRSNTGVDVEAPKDKKGFDSSSDAAPDDEALDVDGVPPEWSVNNSEGGSVVNVEDGGTP
jgi:hypothetical protein